MIAKLIVQILLWKINKLQHYPEFYATALILSWQPPIKTSYPSSLTKTETQLAEPFAQTSKSKRLGRGQTSFNAPLDKNLAGPKIKT